MSDDSPSTPLSFADLGLAEPILRAVDAVGYEAPTPIQAAAIPPLLAGRDLFGQAQTGTGKTAAFALPLLSRLDPATRRPQILVLTPTRELAIQVAEAMQTYARHIPGFHVLPVYGGQSIEAQLRPLQRGVHVVVGTPGRILDHLRRGTLGLSTLTALVLDEADEMLRMGFLEDVEAILEATPGERQVALFSATLPPAIKKIAGRHLRDPVSIQIASPTTTVAAISQRYWTVTGLHKLDALTRILEVEDFEAMLIFVRTKISTVELAEKLEARGFACAALNGDMNQSARERTVERLKGGALDIVVATDVAARGLDVDRISHVVNFDVPYDVEAYVHRIGRTGRAGRQGTAILFVSPREQHVLRSIERATRQPIERLRLPSREDVAGRRIDRFKATIVETIAEQELDFFVELIEEAAREQETTPSEIGAALAYLAQRERPLVPEDLPEPPSADRPEPRKRLEGPPPAPVRHERYRVEVGHQHGVTPGNIVGAIANEAGIDGRLIGRIAIFEDHSVVELPEGMPSPIFRHLAKARVCGQELQLRLAGGEGADEIFERRGPPRSGPPRGGPPRPGAPRGPRSGPPKFDRKPGKPFKPGSKPGKAGPRTPKPRRDD